MAREEDLRFLAGLDGLDSGAIGRIADAIPDDFEERGFLPVFVEMISNAEEGKAGAVDALRLSIRVLLEDMEEEHLIWFSKKYLEVLGGGK